MICNPLLKNVRPLTPGDLQSPFLYLVFILACCGFQIRRSSIGYDLFYGGFQIQFKSLRKVYLQVSRLMALVLELPGIP